MSPVLRTLFFNVLGFTIGWHLVEWFDPETVLMILYVSAVIVLSALLFQIRKLRNHTRRS